jgi:hypothetical protein
MDPLEKIEQFCKEFTPEHIRVFLDVSDKMGIRGEPRRKFLSAINHLTVYAEDGKKGFPHGGKKTGPPKPVAYLIFLLDDLLTQTTDLIGIIYNKLLRRRNLSFTIRRGYDKKLVQLVKEYDAGYIEWFNLVEPIMSMVAVPRNQRNFNYNVRAESRPVNTFNRINKRAALPEAQPYEYQEENPWTSFKTHHAEMPIAVHTRAMLSPPRRTRKSKPMSRAKTPNRPKSPAKGIRI